MSEGVYLIQPREFIKSNENVYKLGRSFHLDNRVKQYPNGSNTILMLNCNNSIACEKYLINLFKTKFIQKPYYGTEYFEGDKKLMIREIINYIASIDDQENKEDKEDKKIVNNEVVINEVVNKEVMIKEKIKEKKIVSKEKIKENSDRNCNNCKHIFKYPSDLKKHFINSYHCKKSNDEIQFYFDNIIKNIKIFNCNKCNKNFSRKDSLERHTLISKCSKF